MWNQVDDVFADVVNQPDPFYAMTDLNKRLNTIFNIGPTYSGLPLLTSGLAGPELIPRLTAPTTDMLDLVNPIGGSTWENLKVFSPSIDVWEDERGLTVQAELPGVPKEKISVDVSPDNVLTICGEKLEECTGHTYRERRWGSFTRSIRLPSHIDSTLVKANYKDGVLHVYAPVIPKKARATIPIGEQQSLLQASEQLPQQQQQQQQQE